MTPMAILRRWISRTARWALVSAALVGAHNTAAETQTPTSVSGTYSTAVTLKENSCGEGITVRPLPTTITQSPGSSTFSLRHGPLTYTGSITSGGSFTTQPFQIDDSASHTRTTIDIKGEFHPLGFTAEAAVSLDRTSESKNCRYIVRWVGTKEKSPTSIERVRVPGVWEPAPPLINARSAHALVSTGDAIYVIGGTGAGGAPVLAVERFDGKKWVVETALPGSGLNAPAAAVIGKRIYVVGGFNTTTNIPSSDVLVYDIARRNWSKAAPLPAPRGGHAAVVMHGKIHVIGGGNSLSTLADHSEYDPSTNRWTERAPLLRSKGSPAAAVLNGKLYSIGGRSGPADFGDVDVYDEAADRWTALAPIEPRGTAGAVVYCNSIFLFGGESQAKAATLGDVLRFGTSDKTWKADADMPTPRNFARAVLFKNEVYVVGGNHSVGMSHSSSGSTTVERFHAGCGR